MPGSCDPTPWWLRAELSSTSPDAAHPGRRPRPPASRERTTSVTEAKPAIPWPPGDLAPSRGHRSEAGQPRPRDRRMKRTQTPHATLHAWPATSDLHRGKTLTVRILKSLCLMPIWATASITTAVIVREILAAAIDCVRISHNIAAGVGHFERRGPPGTQRRSAGASIAYLRAGERDLAE